MADNKTNALENALMLLLFNATTFTGIASGTAGSFWVSLHTANPDEAGDQTTSEVATTGNYEQYARVERPRANSSGGWSVTGGVATPHTTSIDFATKTSGASNPVITYFGLGSSNSGAGTLYYYGAVSPSITVNVGVTPRLTTATSIEEK